MGAAFMNSAFTVDTHEFTNALKLYKDATKKSNVEVVNRAARNIILRSMQFTPKADKAKIAEALEKTVEWNKRQVPLKYLIVNSRRKEGRGLTGAKMARAAQRLINKRKGTSGYIRAGWFKAAEAFGLRAGRVNPRGLAAEGYGRQATLSQLAAELVNAARGAVKVAGPALQAAIDFVAADMRQYGQKKLNETARRYSARS